MSLARPGCPSGAPTPRRKPGVPNGQAGFALDGLGAAVSSMMAVTSRERMCVSLHRKEVIARAEDRYYPPPSLSPSIASTPPIYSMGLLDQPLHPSRPLHLSILWVSWTNLSIHRVHSTYLFYGSLGPTSSTHVSCPGRDRLVDKSGCTIRLLGFFGNRTSSHTLFLGCDHTKAIQQQQQTATPGG